MHAEDHMVRHDTAEESFFTVDLPAVPKVILYICLDLFPVYSFFPLILMIPDNCIGPVFLDPIETMHHIGPFSSLIQKDISAIQRAAFQRGKYNLIPVIAQKGHHAGAADGQAEDIPLPYELFDQRTYIPHGK